ncbi:hypothetical protein MKX01_003590 [Papaver californicum]|nr:hypothetical protein MKX01_003590 [Papaver californicum]
MSGVTDKMVQKHATSFANLTFLDISNCLRITCRGFEILGNNCKSLTSLRRNMPPLDWKEAEKSLPAKVNDGEAMVIADTMEALCHIELCFGRFGDLGLDALLTKCKNLIHLDILGSVCVRLDGDLLDKCECLAVFRGPWMILMPIQTMMATMMKLQSRHQTQSQISDVLGFLVCFYEGLDLIPSVGVSCG